MKRAVVFPGQGSQQVGMGRDLAETYPECRELFDRAAAVLGRDLARVCFEGPQEELNRSDNAQPAIFVVSAAARLALEKERPEWTGDFLAGHSLGEWTALYAAGVVGFEETLEILRVRGEAMQEACEKNPGAMCAVMGLDGTRLEEIAAEAGCYVANYNSLVQTVLSGAVEAIEKAEALAKEAGAKRVVRLPVAGAFHSHLMEPAAEKLAAFLEKVEFAPPRVPVFSNVTGAPHEPDRIRETMVRQVVSPVRWVEEVQRMRAEGAEEFIECGPGKVLAGLIKRIDKGCAVRNIAQTTDLKQ